MSDQQASYNPTTSAGFGIKDQRQTEERLKHDQALSAHQIQAIAKNHADHLAAIKRDVELRKWAVDQACGLVGSMVESEDANSVMSPIELARSIHAFLVEGAKEPE